MRLPPETIGPTRVLEWITQAHTSLVAAERLTTDRVVRDQIREAVEALKPATTRAREILDHAKEISPTPDSKPFPSTQEDPQP